MDDAKIYNVCLMRVKHQILKANERLGNGLAPDGGIFLESYNTGDPDEIIDILELYDLQDRTPSALEAKLEELAYTVSILVKEKIVFAYDGKGNLGLKFSPKESSSVQCYAAEKELIAA